MLRKSKGVVLNQIKYGDSSLITHIYTENYGIQSFIIKGGKSKKQKAKHSFLQALFLIEIESYYKPSRNIQFAKEISPYYIYKTIPFNITKSTIVLFLCEILMKALKEEEKNIKLYDFLQSTLIYFDEHQSNPSNFHLFFLVHLTKHLGFFPNTDNGGEQQFFDIMDGCFTNYKPKHKYYLSGNSSELLFSITKASINDYSKIIIKKKDKVFLLEKIIEYFSIHLEGFGTIKSLQVLNEVFS